MAPMTSTTTVDPAEIARFNDLATTWWDATGPMWPLHKLNEIRVPFIVDSLQRAGFAKDTGGQPLSGLRILDIGCGGGLLSESMAALGARVTGVDPASHNIAIAEEHARNTGLDTTYLTGTIDAINTASFDVVLNMEVVEHVEALDVFMARCCALTRPGGMQFLATLNRNPLSWLVAIVGAEYILRWLPRGTHQWQKFVRPAEAAHLLHQHGLTVVDQRGVSINPLTRHYRISEFTGVNYMLSARKVTDG